MDPETIAELIRVARAEERERCAEVAARYYTGVQETREAHNRHSDEPFRMEKFGFDPALFRYSHEIANLLRSLKD